MKRFLHPVRLALHGVDQHARHLMTIDAAGFKGVFGTGLFVLVINRVGRREDLVSGPTSGFQDRRATDGDRVARYELLELISIQHGFSPLSVGRIRGGVENVCGPVIL